MPQAVGASEASVTGPQARDDSCPPLASGRGAASRLPPGPARRHSDAGSNTDSESKLVGPTPCRHQPSMRLPVFALVTPVSRSSDLRLSKLTTCQCNRNHMTGRRCGRGRRRNRTVFPGDAGRPWGVTAAHPGARDENRVEATPYGPNAIFEPPLRTGSRDGFRNGSAGWAGGPGRQEGSEKFSNDCDSKNRDGSRGGN